MEDNGLPLPACRCLSKEMAAAYLGIGVTLLAELRVPAIKLGRRLVYDKLDLDAWLDEYKQRGRAGKENILWPKKPESTGDLIQGTGGLQLPYRMELEYAQALGLKAEKRQKATSPS